MKYTDIDGEKVVDFGDVAAYEFATLIKNNIAYLNKMIPAGQVTPIMTNIPGCPDPDPNIWQLCDGSEITNPNSPLRSREGVISRTPDMSDHFVRCANGYGESGTKGGTHSANFRHGHGNWTGNHGAPEGADADDVYHNVAPDHAHEIFEDLGTVDMQPPWYTLKYYMKIL